VYVGYIGTNIPEKPAASMIRSGVLYLADAGITYFLFDQVALKHWGTLTLWQNPEDKNH